MLEESVIKITLTTKQNRQIKNIVLFDDLPGIRMGRIMLY